MYIAVLRSSLLEKLKNCIRRHHVRMRHRITSIHLNGKFTCTRTNVPRARIICQKEFPFAARTVHRRRRQRKQANLLAMNLPRDANLSSHSRKLFISGALAARMVAVRRARGRRGWINWHSASAPNCANANAIVLVFRAPPQIFQASLLTRMSPSLTNGDAVASAATK